MSLADTNVVTDLSLSPTAISLPQLAVSLGSTDIDILLALFLEKNLRLLVLGTQILRMIMMIGFTLWI